MDILYFTMNILYILFALVVEVDIQFATMCLVSLIGFQVTGVLTDILKELKKK